MRKTTFQFAISCALLVLLCVPSAPSSAADNTTVAHKKQTGGVTKTGPESLAIKTPEGTTYQLNDGLSKRHGHAALKEGEEVTFVLDENNTVIDVHPKGQEGGHKFVTGKLIYVGKMKNEIKLQTKDGEQVFPLERLEVKTKPIPEGTPVTVELNEAGTVIDLHKADTKERSR